jgi:alpha-glucoside transport system permease protein
MTAICVLWCVPSLGAVITSFRSSDDVNTSGWWTIFKHPSRGLTIAGYRQALFGPLGFARAFLNSVAITLPATFIPILFAAFAAYALVYMRVRARGLIFGLIVAMLIVPNQVTVLPLLKIYSRLGIQGSFATVWLAEAAYALPLAVYILRNFMAALPKEIIDSARVDGATDFQVFWRIVTPMTLPALASFAIFQSSAGHRRSRGSRRDESTSSANTPTTTMASYCQSHSRLG